jgi:hypothetical protein
MQKVLLYSLDAPLPTTSASKTIQKPGAARDFELFLKRCKKYC